jgi:hypothetical protein
MSAKAAAAPDMSDFLIHILALGPQQTQDGLEEAVRKAHEQASRPFAVAAFRTAFPQLTESAGGASAPFRLRPHLLMLANPDWPHYSREQSSALRAIKAGADGGLGPQTNTTPGASGSTEVPRIRSLDEYKAGKRKFDEDYVRYKELDVELAEHTARFLELERRIQTASGAKAREDVEAALLQAFRTHKDSIEARAIECRTLHVQLKRLKTAVNSFAQEHNRNGS